MKRIALALTLFVSLAAPAWAGFDEGQAAYERGDYETAFRKLKPLAEQGNAAAQYNLGVMYGKGEGVPQDDTKSAKWFRMAADQGNATAQYMLGLKYGSIGRGLPTDFVQAYMWLTLAGAQEFTVWLDLAVAAFPPGDKRNAAVRLRKILADSMSPAQIAEAQRLAREWKPKKE